MTDRDWMHDPEHELENAVLADELRTLLHAAPAAPIDPAIRAAEIRDVIQHAWPAGAPPDNGGDGHSIDPPGGSEHESVGDPAGHDLAGPAAGEFGGLAASGHHDPQAWPLDHAPAWWDGQHDDQGPAGDGHSSY